MKFVWDEMKDLANRKKHKVSFVQAVHTLPQPGREELDQVALLEDEAIDCSDIPEINDLSGLQPKLSKEMQVMAHA